MQSNNPPQPPAKVQGHSRQGSGSSRSRSSDGKAVGGSTLPDDLGRAGHSLFGSDRSGC